MKTITYKKTVIKLWETLHRDHDGFIVQKGLDKNKDEYWIYYKTRDQEKICKKLVYDIVYKGNYYLDD